MYAGFWKRAAAYLIDYVLVMVCNYLIAFLIGFASAKLLNLQTDDVPAGVALLAMLVILGFVLVYYVYAESSPWQATVGKRILGIKVTDEHGNRISFWRSLGRRAAMAISSFTFLIGYMMCGWTARKQCLHDKIAGCLVVDKNYVPEQTVRPIRKVPWWTILLCTAAATILITGILAAAALPQYFRAVEVSRAGDAVNLQKKIAIAQQIYRMQTSFFSPTWDNLENLPFSAGHTNYYCIKGPQTSNPKNRYESCGGENGWVLVLGPKEVTAWRTNAWKYRIVVPYESQNLYCMADEEEENALAFCKRANDIWSKQRRGRD